MTVKDFCADLLIGRSTLYRLWATGDGPRVLTLPGGDRGT